MAGGGVGTNQLFVGKILHPELQSVLEKLDEMFGPNLHFISDDGKYINFHVWGLTDDNLFKQLEDNEETIFDGNLSNFQILKPLGRSTDRGVFLRHLHTSSLRQEFKAGFCHY